MSLGIVYSATNLVNNKVYIGYTMTPLYKRMESHKYKASTKDKKYHSIFRLAIRKYGFNNFKWRILSVENSKENAIKKEIELIQKYNTVSKNGYNISKGGNGGSQPKEVVDKIILTLKKLYASGEVTSFLSIVSSEERSKMAKKAWETKKKNNYKPKIKITDEIRNQRKLDKSLKNENKRLEKLKIPTVFCKNIFTREEKEFSTATIAAKELKITPSNVSAVLNNKYYQSNNWLISRNKDELYEKELLLKDRWGSRNIIKK